MAEILEILRRQVWMNRRNEGEKWAKHYSSNHQILLVGEGDFSFSLSLARSFGSASNIVASSLDSYDIVINKYKNAKRNLENLDRLGAQLLYGVDATKMKLDTHLPKRMFDRIVYNFPHAGFLGKEDDHHVIEKHQNLVQDFFRNASFMLRPNGEVHVTHKTSSPFCNWNIEELASQSCLALLECVEFKIQDYPCYENKRGNGNRSDQPFPLGECSTFKFVLSCHLGCHRGLQLRNHCTPVFAPYPNPMSQPNLQQVAWSCQTRAEPNHLVRHPSSPKFELYLTNLEEHPGCHRHLEPRNHYTPGLVADANPMSQSYHTGW